MTRRFFFGFASLQPCNPGEVMTVSTKYEWPRAARAGRIQFSPGAVHFDFLQWHIGDKPQAPRSHVPGSLLTGIDAFLDGDPINPGDIVNVTVMNRGGVGIYFGGAFHMEEIEIETPDLLVASPNGTPPAPPPIPQTPPATNQPS